MSSQDIITYCAPTLVGIKTANIFNERYETEDELKKSISHFNHSFKDYGLRMTSLGEKNNRALIYVYREQALIRDFKNQLSQELLKQYGYDSKDIKNSLHTLTKRIGNSSSFPHEIGLFLGYPPEDVKGFIDNKARNYKFIGYWKVYGDLDKALKSFHSYDHAQKILLDRLKNGYTLKQLVIHK